MSDLEHVFRTVGQRRWCVCCDLFQQRRGSDWPRVGPCSDIAPAAAENREHEKKQRMAE